jgi:hypothetical protein
MKAISTQFLSYIFSKITEENKPAFTEEDLEDIVFSELSQSETAR